MNANGTVLRDRDALEVAARSQLCSLCVQTRLGPHATPQAFAVASDRIWIVTARNSLKVRAIKQQPEAGVLMRVKDRALVIRGTATILSPWPPEEAMRLVMDTPAVAEALTRYGLRNLAMMAGYAMDLCRLPAGALPHDRVLVAVRPESGILLTEDRVTRAWGDWTVPLRGVPRESHAPGPRIPSRVPPDLADLLEMACEATVGWTSEAGPIALPASWDPVRGIARLPASALDAIGALDHGRACITLDRSGALRPTELRGLVLRGDGRISRGPAGWAELEIRPDRITWWHGFRTGTTPGAAQAGSAGRAANNEA